MKKKVILWCMLIAPLIAFSMIGTHVYFLYRAPYSGPETVFTVKPGEGFSQINFRLNKQNIISNARIFHYLARHNKVLEKFKAGSFTIPTGATMEQVLDILVNGTPNLSAVTLPEGKNLYEMARLLEQAELVKADEFIALAKDKTLAEELQIPADTLEGYLYPETYKFAPGTKTKDVITTLVKHFQSKALPVAQGHEFLTPHQVVILASMVEKETGAKEERSIIASVFLNRLKKKMRLESDPTTIYGMWETYKGNIKKDDLLRVTPYNTYKIPALPIGPIANPSLAAVEAVMRPAQTDYLFFVSKNDGTHVFSATYQEHAAAVNEWQRKRSNREGRSWRQLKQN